LAAVVMDKIIFREVQNYVAQALLPVLERDLKDAGTDKSGLCHIASGNAIAPKGPDRPHAPFHC
jgi:hypothetical protein